MFEHKTLILIIIRDPKSQVSFLRRTSRNCITLFANTFALSKYGKASTLKLQIYYFYLNMYNRIISITKTEDWFS